MDKIIQSMTPEERHTYLKGDPMSPEYQAIQERVNAAFDKQYGTEPINLAPTSVGSTRDTQAPYEYQVLLPGGAQTPMGVALAKEMRNENLDPGDLSDWKKFFNTRGMDRVALDISRLQELSDDPGYSVPDTVVNKEACRLVAKVDAAAHGVALHKGLTSNK
jgi:hypothetical protein